MIDLSNPSALIAGVAALLPVVLGGVTTWLKIFIDPQKDFRARIDLKRKELLDGVALQHLVLLKHCLSIDFNSFDRGDDFNDPDLVGGYTRQIFKLFTIFHRLETLKLVVKVAYWVLFTLIGLGVVALLVNLLFDEARACLLWYGVGAVVLELVVIGAVHAASQRLEQYEDIT